ncbi:MULTISPECIES: 1,2-phenylacetyl-CoA epoxidase subunit PaaC [Roseateles]|jgi:ring-1,2-phenylacetyl-CoA epoxidase subunit PaaC|uniref:1,2-phenylacetyl-CoA epoxidase subunit PaaC n=1 Tax=Roseateles TaxID=93681 RepID=UPI000836D613|nr:1,2-phenylacetyl-CoA epoxidase subunit PaaC [Roseateles chitosanitabidus]MBO9688539.1 phenylacetate-CoA oxygenase subunit PaaC [Roseateles chitosanitabidus]
MTASIQPGARADVHYLLRLGDACLVLSHRLSEWCGHSPILEEDLALGNIALDLLGQARALLTRAGQLNEQPLDEDQLAFLREERHYLNPVLMELPRGDFAFTQARNLVAACWLLPLWTRLQHSSDAEVAAIAAKAVKEVRYHLQHAAEWVVRLGDGSEESTRRMQAALTQLWPYVNELFAADDVDIAADTSGLGPTWASLKPEWDAAMDEVLAEARLARPKDTPHVYAGRHGIHSEHMGHMLATMQSLQRAYPGGVW